MSWLLALDPGVRYPACALFSDGKLIAASRVKLSGALAKLPMGERVRQIGNLVHTWVLDHVPSLDKIIYEMPQVYRAGKSKGDPNDLIPLALVAGYVSGRHPLATVSSPKPREWIGQLPKATTGDALASPRGQLVWRRLSDDEKKCVVVSHDAIDAIGIGLFHHDRLIVRVLPGAV